MTVLTWFGRESLFLAAMGVSFIGSWAIARMYQVLCIDQGIKLCKTYMLCETTLYTSSIFLTFTYIHKTMKKTMFLLYTYNNEYYITHFSIFTWQLKYLQHIVLCQHNHENNIISYIQPTIEKKHFCIFTWDRFYVCSVTTHESISSEFIYMKLII